MTFKIVLLFACLTIGEAVAQVKTVLAPDYFPVDRKTYCRRTFNITLGPTGQTHSEIIGSMTVPYTSGPLSGPLVCEVAPGDRSLSTWYNDGITLKNLMDSDHFPSTDPLLTAFPPEISFGLIQDKQYVPPQPPNPPWLDIKKGLSYSYVGGDWDDIYWFRIQDVTVQGRLYRDALIMWEFESGYSPESLKLHGKDVKLGFTPPTKDDLRGRGVNNLLILAKGVGLIAAGGFDELGELVFLGELVSISCNDKAPEFDAFDVPGTRITRAHGGNERGDIVGEYQWNTTTPIRGFLRDKNGTLTLIDVPGAIETSARDINDRGDIVGWYRPATTPARWRGFLLSNGVFTDIVVPNAFLTQALGINNRGDIVGQYMALGSTHGFLLRNGSFSPIDYPGAIRTFPMGINEQGDIAGSYGLGSEGSQIRHGFLLSLGTYSPIEFPGAIATNARGINAAGDIVGIYWGQTPGGPQLSRGFLLSKGVFQSVETPCSFQSALNDITNQGDAIGEFLDSPYFEASGDRRPNGAWYGFRVSPK